MQEINSVSHTLCGTECFPCSSFVIPYIASSTLNLRPTRDYVAPTESNHINKAFKQIQYSLMLLRPLDLLNLESPIQVLLISSSRTEIHVEIICIYLGIILKRFSEIGKYLAARIRKSEHAYARLNKEPKVVGWVGETIQPIRNITTPRNVPLGYKRTGSLSGRYWLINEYYYECLAITRSSV